MRWVFLINLARLLLKASELGIRVIVFTFYRSVAAQLEEFEAGRSRVRFGFHQSWLAVDLALWDDVNADWILEKDEIRWTNDLGYQVLGEYWESLGGVWGGRWGDPVDPYHFEWSKRMSA